MNYLKSLWSKVPLGWKQEITSFLHTFIASLALTIALQLQADVIPASKDALVALAVAALRSALKAAFNKTVLKK